MTTGFKKLTVHQTVAFHNEMVNRIDLTPEGVVYRDGRPEEDHMLELSDITGYPFSMSTFRNRRLAHFGKLAPAHTVSKDAELRNLEAKYDVLREDLRRLTERVGAVEALLLESVR